MIRAPGYIDEDPHENIELVGGSHGGQVEGRSCPYPGVAQRRPAAGLTRSGGATCERQNPSAPRSGRRLLDLVDLPQFPSALKPEKHPELARPVHRPQLPRVDGSVVTRQDYTEQRSAAAAARVGGAGGATCAVSYRFGLRD